MSLKDALEARELYLQHKENPLLKRGLDLKEIAKPMTNGDRIRAMTDAELASFMAERNVNESTLLLINEDYALTAVQIEAIKHRVYCAYMQWLRQPVKGDE